jgi:hypothetical protein
MRNELIRVLLPRSYNSLHVNTLLAGKEAFHSAPVILQYRWLRDYRMLMWEASQTILAEKEESFTGTF